MRSHGVQILTVAEDYNGQRLDNFLLRELKGLPRTHLYKLLRTGQIRVNKKRCKPSLRLVTSDQVRVPPLNLSDQSTTASPSENFRSTIKASCLYEDKQLIVFNKPSGIAVHGGSGIKLGFIEAVRQTYEHAQKWELVHRIDRGTSGCLMVAKKRSYLKYMHQQLRDGKIEKKYWALVNGNWAKAITVRAPLQKRSHPNGEAQVMVRYAGKQACTKFVPLQHYKQASLVEAQPITGRTHQIRVHAQYQGHSLAGDSKYAESSDNQAWRRFGLSRLFLHAKSLCFDIEPGREIRIEAPLANELTALLDKLEE